MENKQVFNYIEIVCNFLNNTQGNIKEYQIVELIKVIQCGEYDTLEILPFITEEIVEQLSEDIECDNYKDFYTKLSNLSHEIERGN